MNTLNNNVAQVCASCPASYGRHDIAKRIQSKFPEQSWEKSKAQAFFFILHRNTNHIPDEVVKRKIEKDIYLSDKQQDKIIGKETKLTVLECVKLHLK